MTLAEGVHLIMKYYGSYKVDDFFKETFYASQYFAMVGLIEIYEKKKPKLGKKPKGSNKLGKSKVPIGDIDKIW